MGETEPRKPKATADDQHPTTAGAFPSSVSTATCRPAARRQRRHRQAQCKKHPKDNTAESRAHSTHWAKRTPPRRTSRGEHRLFPARVAPCQELPAIGSTTASVRIKSNGGWYSYSCFYGFFGGLPQNMEECAEPSSDGSISQAVVLCLTPAGPHRGSRLSPLS